VGGGTKDVQSSDVEDVAAFNPLFPLPK